MQHDPSLRIEEPEEIQIGDIGFKTIEAQMEMNQHILSTLRNLIIAQQEQRRVWDFAGHTAKALYSLSNDIEDLCNLTYEEQEAVRTKMQIMRDLIK